MEIEPLLRLPDGWGEKGPMTPNEIAIAYRYIHLETVVLLFFLASVLWNQVARAQNSLPYAQRAKAQAYALIGVCTLLAVTFLYFLGSLSPLLAVELAVGFTLALLHPMNAFCFFVHMFFLRPWEVMPPDAFLLQIPKLLAVTCLVSWIL